MKKTLRRIALVLSLVMIFVIVAACAPSDKKKEDEKIKVAFIPQLTGIPYFTAMENGGNRAAETLGVEFIYSGSTEVSAAEQVQLFDSLIRQKVDAICVSVLDSSSIDPIISKAKAEGLHPFTSDSDSPNSEREVYVAQAMDKDLGYILIDEMIKLVGKDGKIGIVSGDATATNLNAWISFMEERAKQEYPDLEIVDVRHATTSEESLRQAQDLMTANPDLGGIVAVASINIPGVAQAVEQANKIGEVAVIGYGSPLTVKPYIESGVMPTSILWNAEELGYLMVWAGQQLVLGNDFKAENTVPGIDRVIEYIADEGILLLGPPLVITADNVDDFEF